MKKLLTVLLFLVITMSLIISAGAAESVDNFKVEKKEAFSYTEYEEITDIEKLSQRVSQGISDIPLKNLPIFDVKALIECNDESLSLNAKKTCQILSETVRNNKDVERTIVITSIVEIDERIFSTISGGGIDYNYQWDGSYGVKAYSSNYYSVDSNGEYRLDRVTGGWNISDNQLGYKDEKVVYGQSGFSSDAPGGYTQSSNTYYPSGYFSRYTGYQYHVNTGVYSGIGNTTTAKVFRWLNENITWTLTLINQV